MKKILLASGLLLSTLSFAQIDLRSTRFGVTIGGNYSRVKNAHNPSGPRMTMQAGLVALIPLGSKNGWQLKGKLDFAYEYELANLNEKEKARLIAIEDGYHDLAKPEEENGQFKTRAALGLEVNERYGIFINGEYTFGEHNQDEYRAGVTLKAVF